MKSKRIVAKNNPKDIVGVVLGDDKEDVFHPQMKLERWNNEVNLSVRLKDFSDFKVSSRFGVVRLRGSKKEVKLYELPPSDDLKEGGFEFEVILNEKPESNVIEFSLDTKGLVFLYQPELTDEEREGGCVRPDNVIGSYAVYASEEKINRVGGKEYKCGKVCHIYRPRIEDSEGKWCWGGLHIEKGEPLGILRVTIPQEFLDKAVYPVRHASGSLFGYDTAGGSATDTDYPHGSKFVLSDLADTESITASIFAGNGDGIIFGIFDNSDNFVAETSGNLVTQTYTKYWHSDTVSTELSPGTYWLLKKVDGSAASSFNMYYDADGTSGDGGFYTNYNNAWEDPWTTYTGGTKKYSIYCTYEALAATLDQEGFAFGDDDGNEAGHSLDTQDTDVTTTLGTKTLRVIVDTSDYESEIAYKLKFQKGGSGGYEDVGIGAGGTTAVSIESGDCTQSGDNATTQTFTMTIPAYEDGDLIVLNVGVWQDNNDSQGVSWPSGPNSETINTVTTGYGGSGNADIPIIAIGWFIGDGSYAGGTIVITADDATARWDAVAIMVPSGEFDTTTPISANDTQDNSGVSDVTDIDMPAFSSASNDADGRLIVFGCSDQDPWSNSPPVGYTELVEHDMGRIAIGVWGRDSAVTNSENIASATFDLAGAGTDALAIYGYIIRPLDVVNEVYVDTSTNVATGGEATTARLTAPSGKTGDFSTGRRWDDENGTDSVSVGADYYTELEWVLTTQSPATTDDYFEFRVYNGNTAFDSYTETPKWTIGEAGPAKSIKDIIQCGIIPVPR